MTTIAGAPSWVLPVLIVSALIGLVALAIAVTVLIQDDSTSGTNGTNGSSGSAGQTGQRGPQGPPGTPGKTGDEGPPGPAAIFQSQFMLLGYTQSPTNVPGVQLPAVVPSLFTASASQCFESSSLFPGYVSQVQPIECIRGGTYLFTAKVVLYGLQVGTSGFFTIMLPENAPGQPSQQPSYYYRRLAETTVSTGSGTANVGFLMSQYVKCAPQSKIMLGYAIPSGGSGIWGWANIWLTIQLLSE